MLFALAIKCSAGLRRAITALAALYFLFLLIDAAAPLPAHKIEKDYSHVYMARDGEILRISLSKSEQFRFKLPLKEISPLLRDGIIFCEDRFFFYHRGVNPVSILRALYLNLRHGEVRSGASTITMQIARMLERRPRTVLSKIIEAFRAVQLEFHYTKTELLELYLNTIPMGGNLEGVGAGALYYFGKSARDLGPAEAAMLIAVPKDPNRYRPDLHPRRAHEQMLRVMSAMGSDPEFSGLYPGSAQGNGVFTAAHPFPFRCPHLIESGKGEGDPFFTRFTIDRSTQSYCEKALKDYTDANRSQGIYNGAVIVVDNRSRQVLAYAGSPDYFDRDHCGQINGAGIPRSPGSALKPFLYARAMEQGMITPETAVYDIPIKDSDYSPVNYNRTSDGLVTAQYALVHSLNIPAVRLEKELGDRGLKGVLKKIFPLEKDVIIGDSGLSVVLGGYAVSLERMASLYMMLARGGTYDAPVYTLDPAPVNVSPRTILTEEAAYIVSEMLSNCYRPDLPHSWEFTPYRARVSLKTGTSFGLRDAWCIGYNPDYTVAVWQGNADNSFSPFLVGVHRAAPLMIKIINHLTYGKDVWFSRPRGVRTRKVCALTGMKPGPCCGNAVKEDYYIPGISSEKTCDVHREITVRKSDGCEVCPLCMKGDPGQYRKRVVEFWPAEVHLFLKEQGHRHSEIPPHNPECTRVCRTNKPRIIKPGNGAEFEIDDVVPLASQRIALQAFSAQDAESVFWLCNNEIIARGGPGETFFLVPKKGKWKISVVDSKGRSDSVTIRIY